MNAFRLLRNLDDAFNMTAMVAEISALELALRLPEFTITGLDEQIKYALELDKAESIESDKYVP